MSEHPCPHLRSKDEGGSTSSSGSGSLPKALTTLAISAGVAALSYVISEYVIPPTPPKPEKEPQDVIFGEVEGKNHGKDIMTGEDRKVVTDEYAWMRDDKRKNPRVLRHLRKENHYTKKVMRPLNGFVKNLYKEMKGHLQETDQSVPYYWGGWYYYSRTEEGKSYSIACRKKTLDGKEVILLDENEMAKGKKYFDLRGYRPSPDHTILGYTVDEKGDEKFTLYFKLLKENDEDEMLKDTIRNVTGSFVWGRDNSEVYYTTMDESQRSNKVWRHIMGTKAENDVCLYTENDPVYNVGVHSSTSKRFIYLSSQSSVSTEIHFIDQNMAVKEEEIPKLNLVSEREPDLLYDVEECGSDFYIVTNADDATNFKLMRTPIASPERKNWKDYLPYNPKASVAHFSCYVDEEEKPYGVLCGREGGFSQIWFVPNMKVEGKYMVEFDETAHDVWMSTNEEYKTNKIRFGFTSMTTPTQSWEYDVKSKTRKLLKQRPIPNCDPKLYSSKQITATSPDGTKVPMSLVWKKGSESKGPRPCHLKGYGSYEIPSDPVFSTTFLPLIDRGVVVVIAHIRGGGEFGRSWYEAAKFETKKKTFDDFIACAKHLIDTGVTSPDRLTTEGRSAGGLLMGSVLNMAPTLFKAAIAGVPFVTVLLTMSDPSIPLTTGEWLEWGNPHQEKYFDVIKEYCPYTNVGPKKYPAILVTAGLHDPRVAYWEPAKWVAKLREHTKGEGKILFKVDLESGHFSASDRYRYLKQRAFELAFILDQLSVPREIVDKPVVN